MQKINHGTRAFFWNADGLQGFVIKLDIMELLYSAEQSGDLEKVTKWQIVDLRMVVAKLKSLYSKE